jgi:zinc D-Ala-D-Ala carboxypeptidase
MKNISEHISYKEGIFSATALRYGIDNTPNDCELKAMLVLAEKIFEPLRNHFGVPIKINSFYRCLALNKRVGGSSSSQHVKGEAIDIDDTFGGVTNKQMFDWIVANLDFDMIIWEFGNSKNPDWVHVSYSSPEKNRRIKLRAVKRNGKTSYEKI